MDTITKRRSDAPPGFFAAEAAGLRWLADAGGARVVRVESVHDHEIVLERIRERSPDRESARAFGAALAHTHAAGASAFGSPPDGWDGPLFIGNRRMASARESSWGRFYARDRVLPFLSIARRVGGITEEQDATVREACDRIAGGYFDDDEPAARIHGDLWNGNVLWAEGGVALIDPAAHGGHRETDLAMLALFGCPWLDEILAGYQAARPLRTGWEARVPLHQLHPLAVHAAGHGASYGRALQRAAEVVLAL
jgi:fructosamine-3-kinase